MVDERTLAAALARKQVAGAGLDVFERERGIDGTLLGLDNVVLLPHVGSATPETRVELGRRTVANIHHFTVGREVLDRVV